ncbi:UNVERIFIED_ORG: hypothetical protein OKW25_003495 [Pseudomonas vranovensis]|nr:hypothetical protein [Pseudomonas vranovensis]
MELSASLTRPMTDAEFSAIARLSTRLWTKLKSNT